MTSASASRTGIVLLGTTIAAYPLVAPGAARDLYYDLVAAACVAHAFLGLRRQRPLHARGWLLTLAGFLGWVVGDVVYSVEQRVLHLDGPPAPSDAVYLASYALIVLGLLDMVRGRRTARDLAPLLDAAIVATGCAVIAGVFVIAPIAQDSTTSLAGRLTSSSYPVADVLLLGILVRLWATPGARTASSRLLVLALTTTLAGDVAWNLLVLAGHQGTSPAWDDVLWLAGYLLVAAAVHTPSMHEVAQPAAERPEHLDPQRRLLVLGAGLVLPGIALLVDGATGDGVSWGVVGVGSALMSALVLARVAGLLRVVQVQAVQLAALARSDALTGAPNRRTWDHELSRACRTALEQDSPLVVAILDLDRFKAFNDTHGHQAGDLLLREAVAAWTELLGPGDMLARYGGEEFALLLPGLTPAEAAARLDQLRRRTPQGQTFSAGVALWDPATEPSVAVAAADRALYDAKLAGRDRVHVAGAAGSPCVLPELSIVLQPIVGLHDGVPVAVEALSRFEHTDPPTAFAEAYRTGNGPELEAAAIGEALRHRPATGLLNVNVSVEAITSPAVLAVLPEDMSGIVLEITEHTDVERWAEVTEVVERLRERGATIAVDDWGQGYSNLDRLLRLRPQVLKIDLSLVQSLDSDLHRTTIRSVTAWARSLGITVCAEGIETERQWRTLQALGVDLGQGYLFGRPAAPVTPSGQPASVG